MGVRERMSIATPRTSGFHGRKPSKAPMRIS
jgi:hypothetical protein